MRKKCKYSAVHCFFYAMDSDRYAASHTKLQ